MIRNIFSFVALFLNNGVQTCPVNKNKCACSDGLKENFPLIDLMNSI